MKNKNSSLIFESLKQQFNDKIDQLAQELTQNQVEVKSLNINMLELVMKVYNEGNPYLDNLDTESDINGTDYFIQL